MVGQNTLDSAISTHINTDIGTAHPNGNLPTSRLDGTVSTSQIADNAVTSDKIPTGAVGSDEVVSGAIGSDEIATNAVTTDEILDGTITTTDLSSTSFTSWDQNESDDLKTSTTFGGDVSGTYDSITVTDDSHSHGYAASSHTHGYAASDHTHDGDDLDFDSGTTTIDDRYVNENGDTMTGDLNMGGNEITNFAPFSAIDLRVVSTGQVVIPRVAGLANEEVTAQATVTVPGEGYVVCGAWGVLDGFLVHGGGGNIDQDDHWGQGAIQEISGSGVTWAYDGNSVIFTFHMTGDDAHYAGKGFVLYAKGVSCSSPNTE